MNRRERASLDSAEQPVALLRPTRSSETLIFLPTYNECDTIGRMIDALLALPIARDVLVVDDRSTDGTTGILVSRAAAEPRLAVMVRPGKLGIGSAHILGWMHARRLGYRRIVTLDADFSHDPGDIPRLLAAPDQGADVVIGSRFATGGRLDYVGWRRFVSRSANYLARTALGLPISEYTTSLRAARLDRVPEGLVETVESGGIFFPRGAQRHGDPHPFPSTHRRDVQDFPSRDRARRSQLGATDTQAEMAKPIRLCRRRCP